MQNVTQSEIAVGDRVLVALNGAVHELEVVNVPPVDQAKKVPWRLRLAHLILRRPVPSVVTVKLPDGGLMSCQLFQVARS